MKKIISICMLCLFFAISSSASNTRLIPKNEGIKNSFAKVEENKFFEIGRANYSHKNVFGRICTTITIVTVTSNGTVWITVTTVCTEFNP